MFQVVGGTDRLAAGFAAKLADRITYNAEVREIRQKDHGVEISYMLNGAAKTIAADYGVSAMPMTIISKLPVVDLDEGLKKEMAAVQYAASGKIGLQFKRRFWEEDDQIFGGISRTDQDITQIVYPSHGYLGRKGVLIGYYQSGAKAAEMAARTPRRTRGAGARARQADPSAIRDRVRVLVLGVVAEREIQRGRVGADDARGAQDAVPEVARAGSADVLRRGSLQQPDGVDVRRARVRPFGRVGGSHAREGGRFTEGGGVMRTRLGAWIAALLLGGAVASLAEQQPAPAAPAAQRRSRTSRSTAARRESSRRAS